MGGPGWLTSKGFVGFNDIGQDRGSVGVGGRVDLRKEINDIKFTASITDASARDYEAAPWLKDSIITAEKRLNGEYLSDVLHYHSDRSWASCAVFNDSDVTCQHWQHCFQPPVSLLQAVRCTAFLKHVRRLLVCCQEWSQLLSLLTSWTIPETALSLSPLKPCVVPLATSRVFIRFVDLADCHCVVSQQDSTFTTAIIKEVIKVSCRHNGKGHLADSGIFVQTTAQWALGMTLVHRMPLSV